MKIVKRVFLTICALFLLQSCIVSTSPNMAFFRDNHNDFKNVTFESINVPLFLAKPYIKKALREEGESEEVIKLVKKVSKIKVLTVENGDRTMLNGFTEYLNNNNYEDWATIKHDGENINVRVRQNGEAIKNMLITVNSDKDLVLVDIKGNFTTHDISRMINSFSDK